MLPHPVNFVCRLPEGCPDLYGRPQHNPLDPDSLKSYLGGEVNWVLRTYLILKRKNLNVSLSRTFVPGQICVIAPWKFGIRHYPVNCFVVGCRADFARPAMCEISIVQNKLSVRSDREIYIPYWPQPGLLPRLAERGCRVQNVVFKGRSWNLHHTFRSTEFLAELAKLGVRFEAHDEHGNPGVDWSDYRTCDVILAVRDLTEHEVLVKPASKLVNAWIAGVPAILGPEPAFREHRQSALDYIEVKTPAQALAAIRRLQSQPDVYEQFVANGRRRGQEFSEDLIAQKWVDALSGPVAEQYSRWLKAGPLARLAKYPIRSIQQKLAYRSTTYHRTHGPRIISEKGT